MNNHLLSICAAAAVLFTGCASQHRWTCRPWPDPFELSPSHRNDRAYGVTLISISRSRRVTIRLAEGKPGYRLAYARPGEEFKLRDGSSTQVYRLRSVDLASGKVVVEGTIFAMSGD